MRLAPIAACAVALMGPYVRAEPQRAARSGQIDVLTFNVAGLPEGLSNVHPQQTLPVVGGLLNKFDVVLVQEDYAYPQLLRERLSLPYRSAAFVRGEALHFGDGLSLFSRLPMRDVQRAPWSKCHGVVDSYFDCLTPKGLARSQLQLAPSVSVDVYNVHLDAGPSKEDVAARRSQLQQLADLIKNASHGRALLLGGDFNLTPAELPQFRSQLAALQISDACDELRCPQGFRIDRVLYRSSVSVSLKPRLWRIPAGFRDAAGGRLSDHEPVSVTFNWAAK